MLRDVFYYGKKPNVHPKERPAKNLADARKQATTEHFWVINEFCDYTNFDWDFDFEFLPDEDVWAENHNNVWPSIHQKDSGTWLCPKENSDVIVYRADVDSLKRKNVINENWKLLDLVDTDKWDFSWHPDPTDPPFVYKWGSKYAPVELKTCIEYHVEGAVGVKYMDTTVELLPHWDCIVEVQKVDHSHWDMSWRPDPLDPPFIYVWGNKYIDGRLRSTLEYHVPGATEKKYMPELVPVLPEWDRWELLHEVDKTSFDFTWRPDPREPDFIYVFGNDQYDGTVMPTIEYRMPAATVKKYNDTMKARLASHPEKFQHLEKADGIDYSWVPDPTAPPYIYAWGNQWNKPEDKISIQYVVEGATEYKYMVDRAKRKPCMDNWEIPDNVDTTGFDFSWEPSPADPAYIYEFGTQWQKTGGPRYVVEGATEVKYIDFQKAKALVTKKNWSIPSNLDITGFDFSWHPDATSPPYIYNFATQWALTGGPVYTCDGATEVKYLETPSAIALPDKTNWQYDPKLIDESSFDFSWHPYVEDQPYIYQFGTQHQKTGGPRYVTPGALSTSSIKYIDTRILKATRLPNRQNFAVLNNYKIKDFDWSWHPDESEEAYIYVFGNNLYPAEIMPTIEYAMPGAKQIKYVHDVVAILDVDMTNWEVPDGIDTSEFDFTWKPNPKDPAYVYQFGTQHQKTGGPRYVMPDATEIKYIDAMKVTKLADKSKFAILDNLVIDNFDYSWHPDDTEEPYIYVFGNNQYSAEIMPTIEYAVEGAKQIKYVTDIVATLGVDKSNWAVPDNIDATEFDFSWKPNPKDPPYIYRFGTQHQKTGGPWYVVPGATETKYVEGKRAIALPKKDRFAILDNLVVVDFDYSWHPDETEEPYIYVFGNNQYPAEIMPTIEYAVKGATQVKYVADVSATLGVDMNNWEIPENVDTTGFDFSWKPNPKDPAYTYEFGTQWQKTGGPKYVVPGATEVKYSDTQKVKALPRISNWTVPKNLDITGFDFSWHPDATSPPYIYHFATQWALTGGPIYKCEGATEVKYLETPSAIALPDKTNWQVPNDVDASSFDFSWHPYVEDQPYIYQFGTQWQKTGGPRYVTPGALSTSPVKYIDTRILKAKKLPRKQNFAILNNYKIKEFDYSWHPDESEEPYIYVFGNTLHSAEVMPTLEYRVDGATKVKYVHDVVAVLAEDMTNWEIPDNVDVSEFDFSWKPNPKEPAYIYQFGTQWQKTGGPRYVVPDATQVKYVDGSKAKALPNKDNWVMPFGLDVVDFDYSWHPDATESAYEYIFPTQWQLTGGPRYVVEGASELKFMDGPVAQVGPNKKNWEIPAGIVLKDFDFSWHPHPDDPTFIYEFATQWHDRGGPRYIAPGANKDTPVKYIDGRIIKATLGPHEDNWVVPPGIEIANFDYSWVPHPNDPPYIYRWGNKFISGTFKPTIEYHAPGAKEYKYMDDNVEVKPEWDRWEIPDGVDTKGFDFSWRPDPLEPDLIWQFGTQWQKTGGPRYVMPGATEVKYDGSMHVRRLANKKNWFNPYKADVTTFDYSWHPDETSPAYIYQFGSEEGENDGPRYIAPGATGDVIYLKRVEVDPTIIEEVVETKPEPEPVVEVVQEPVVVEQPVEKCDVFLVDRGNPETQARFEYLKSKLGNVQKTRYLNSWVDTINRCINRSTTQLCWILNSELDYTDFDFNYYPNPYQMKMVHVFGTQWSNWGTTFMVNRETFPTDTKWIKIIEHLSNLNFVKSQYVNRLAKATNVLYDVYYIDHGNTPNLPVSNVVPYDTDYLTTFKNILAKLPEKKEHYIWIASTVCDYTDFDFTYICDPFAREQLHVFPSDKQKYGDTFLVNVNRLRELVVNMESLKDYDKINFNQHQRTKRLSPPTIVTEFDSHVASVMQDFDFPYAVFVTEDNKDIVAVEEEPMSLWDSESKNILITSTGGTRIVVPKEAKQYVETQLYDYPYIKTASRLAKSKPLDIVYLSNGESCAEENYEHLLKVTKGLPNRIVRVDGVDGRVQAYHAAAEASETPWMFTVFAKLKLNAKFDFNWQPDRLQIPKHYMFLAKNPVNGLIYGHQGMIAYNKEMTLSNPGYGLDFTLDSPHETVELLSGIATYNTDEWSTWRTAFREVIKLKKEDSEISNRRLEAWMTKATGDFAEYSIDGALDGVAYYNEVDGKTDKLRLSYEWAWLRQRFDEKYKK